MRLERIVWIVALLAVAGIGFFSGQTVGGRASAQTRAQAAQQFNSERGGGQAAGGTGAQGAGAQAGGFGGRGVSGTVSAVSGNTITLTTRDGATTTVQLAADGTVRKQVDGQLSDIKAGEQVTAIGTQSGDTFQATSIQVGTAGGFRQGGQGGGQNATQVPAP